MGGDISLYVFDKSLLVFDEVFYTGISVVLFNIFGEILRIISYSNISKRI